METQDYVSKVNEARNGKEASRAWALLQEKWDKFMVDEVERIDTAKKILSSAKNLSKRTRKSLYECIQRCTESIHRSFDYGDA
jgi:hypothetical protein